MLSNVLIKFVIAVNVLAILNTYYVNCSCKFLNSASAVLSIFFHAYFVESNFS